MADRLLLLVDGHAVLYKAFYAIPCLSTKTGIYTNALFGFIRMVKTLLSIWNPTHVVVAFDGGLPADRLALHAAYKAHRKPMPDELRSQIPLVEEYLRLLGVKSVRMEKQEADDILAALAKQGAIDGVQVLVATSDKDILQIVGTAIRLVPLSGKDARESIGPAEVKAKTGVEPDQVIDWLALTGDTADNIPGVPGVGAKTAAKLLGEFGSVDRLMSNLDDVTSERIREALRTHRDLLIRNLDMVRLRSELVVPVTWKELGRRESDVEGLIRFFEMMEFHAMAKDLREPDLFSGG